MIRNTKKLIKKNKGQSVLEFALILPFILFFFFLHVQLCLSYVLAEFMNYTSFMSARTVLTNGHLQGKHHAVVNNLVGANLRKVIELGPVTLKRYNEASQRFDFASTNIRAGAQYNYQASTKDKENRKMGVVISYKIPVFAPFLNKLANRLRFEAKTFLGREPFHGKSETIPWHVEDPVYGDSFAKDSACQFIYNDNGC